MRRRRRPLRYTSAVAIPPEARNEAEAALAAFCADHSSDIAGDKQRYTFAFETNAVVLVEQRPGFLNANDWTSKPIAKFRYSEARGNWTLYWAESSGKWHRVSNVEAEKDIRALLDVVVKDPLGVFWS
jgi:hypothetical protein